jgi:3-phenylpropionate/cinnamic acid dioxygenase small subunit
MAAQPQSPTDLAAYIYREARLLDEKRFDLWYDLYTDDARYWMPLTRGQPEGETYTSLFYEDKFLLKVRIDRLRHPNAFSQQQPSFCQHVLQQPAIEEAAPASGEYRMRTPFLYVETQLDSQIVLAGVAHHHLISGEAGLRIRMKKIELLNCDAALPSIQLLI